MIANLRISPTCCYFQKQPSRGFLGKSVLKICSKFTGEHPCRSVISIKLLCNFIEIAFSMSALLKSWCIFSEHLFIITPLEECLCMFDVFLFFYRPCYSRFVKICWYHCYRYHYVMLAWQVSSYYRSSHPELFCLKGALKNFAKLTVKHLCQSLFFKKVAGLRKCKGVFLWILQNF